MPNAFIPLLCRMQMNTLDSGFIDDPLISHGGKPMAPVGHSNSRTGYERRSRVSDFAWDQTVEQRNVWVGQNWFLSDRLGKKFARKKPNVPIPSLMFDVLRPPSCIRGNGEPQRVTLGVLEFRPKLEYITIPKLYPKAFLRATMHNTSEYALLDGPANVYIDSNFTGKVSFSPTRRLMMILFSLFKRLHSHY